MENVLPPDVNISVKNDDFLLFAISHKFWVTHEE